MSAQTDLHYSLDRAANATLDAACACRSARAGPIPEHHRRLIARALNHLQSAQLDLFYARRESWELPSQSPKARQMELELAA